MIMDFKLCPSMRVWFRSACAIVCLAAGEKICETMQSSTLCRACMTRSEVERAILQEPALGPLNVVTESKRWGHDMQAVYVDLWKLGFAKEMKNGGALWHTV